MAEDRAPSQSRGPGARLARMADRALSLIAAALLMQNLSTWLLK